VQLFAGYCMVVGVVEFLLELSFLYKVVIVVQGGQRTTSGGGAGEGVR
jgi:hypothetical protein